MPEQNQTPPGWTRIYAWAHPFEVSYTPKYGEPGFPDSVTVLVDENGVDVPDQYAGHLLQSGQAMNRPRPSSRHGGVRPAAAVKD